MESKTVSRAKSHIKSNIKQTVLSSCPHHLIVGHNKNQSNQSSLEECNLQLTEEMFKKFLYICDLPKPLLPPSKIRRDCSGKEDSSMQLVYTKHKMQEDINRYLEFYKRHSSTLEKYIKRNIKWHEEKENTKTKLPRFLAETAEIVEYDPDPYFSGNYNWYYSGGTLNGILYDMRNILVFPYADELIALPIYLKEYSLFMPDFKNATKISSNGNIFQTICSTFNNSGRILTRYKNNCTVYSLFNLDKSKLQLLEVNQKLSDIPYISADLDPLDIYKYCTTDVDRNIKIWDTTKSQCILSGSVPVMRIIEDNWAFIKYDLGTSNILNYIDRHCVHYYDTRLPIDRAILTMCPKDNLEECESLSTYVASCKSEYFSYVGSNHNFCLLDNRSPNTAVVKKWTHQFKSSPLFSDVCFRENEEFIVIASQLAGETAIILNNWITNETPPESCSIPFTPPSSIETLKALRSGEKSLDPHLQNRLLSCNTGCITTVDKQTGDIFLLTQNSINDIFYQGIRHQESSDFYSLVNCKSLYKLKAWERQILNNNCHNAISPLVVTKRTNARDVFRNFTNQKLRSVIEIDKQDKPFEETPEWKRSVAELNSFIDIFAPELLAPWQMPEEVPLVPITVAPHQKVLSWLETTETTKEVDIPKETIDKEKPIFVKSQELDIYQDQDVFITHDSESIQHLFLPKVRSHSQPANMKKKTKQTKFVPGF